MTSDTARIQTAVQTKPATSADGKSMVKKTTEKKDDLKKPISAKKDTAKSDGSLALHIILSV